MSSILDIREGCLGSFYLEWQKVYYCTTYGVAKKLDQEGETAVIDYLIYNFNDIMCNIPLRFMWVSEFCFRLQRRLYGWSVSGMTESLWHYSTYELGIEVGFEEGIRRDCCIE